MRCPRCAHYQGVNREGMRCTQCGYQFVLNPKRYRFLTDRRAISTAVRLSRNGEVAFTPRQVVGALAERRRFLWWMRAAKEEDVELAVEGLGRLRGQHPSFERMLAVPGLSGAGTAEWPEPDLYDYGAERILVVDGPLVVDLLVDVGVHVAARAVVLDVSGYPPRIAELARALVEDRPGVPVAMLHASGADVGVLRERVGALLGRPSGILDIGLSPDAARNLRWLRWARRLGSVPLDALPRWFLASTLVEALLSGRALDSVGDADRSSSLTEGLVWMFLHPRGESEGEEEQSDGDYG